MEVVWLFFLLFDCSVRRLVGNPWNCSAVLLFKFVIRTRIIEHCNPVLFSSLFFGQKFCVQSRTAHLNFADNWSRCKDSWTSYHDWRRSWKSNKVCSKKPTRSSFYSPEPSEMLARLTKVARWEYYNDGSVHNNAWVALLLVDRCSIQGETFVSLFVFANGRTWKYAKISVCPTSDILNLYRLEWS